MKSLMEYLWKLYTEPDANEISRSTTGYTLLMTARGSSVLKDYYKTLIPLVLLARFTMHTKEIPWLILLLFFRNDISEEIGKIFKAVWDGLDSCLVYTVSYCSVFLFRMWNSERAITLFKGSRGCCADGTGFQELEPQGQT